MDAESVIQCELRKMHPRMRARGRTWKAINGTMASFGVLPVCLSVATFILKPSIGFGGSIFLGSKEVHS